MAAIPTNPDSRPLPPGWTSYHDNQKGAWYYLNIAVSPPQMSYTHPAEKTHAAPPQGIMADSSGSPSGAKKLSLAQQLYASSANNTGYSAPYISTPAPYNVSLGGARSPLAQTPSPAPTTSPSSLTTSPMSASSFNSSLRNPAGQGLLSQASSSSPSGTFGTQTMNHFETQRTQSYQGPSLVTSAYQTPQRSATFAPGLPAQTSSANQPRAIPSVTMTARPPSAYTGASVSSGTSMTAQISPPLVNSQTLLPQGSLQMNIVSPMSMVGPQYLSLTPNNQISPQPLQISQGLATNFTYTTLQQQAPPLPPKDYPVVNKTGLTTDMAARKAREGAQQTAKVFKQLGKASKNAGKAALKIAGGVMFVSTGIPPQVVASAGSAIANSVVNSEMWATLASTLSSIPAEQTGIGAQDIQAVLQGQLGANYQAVISALMVQQQQQQQLQQLQIQTQIQAPPAPAVNYQALINELQRIQNLANAQAAAQQQAQQQAAANLQAMYQQQSQSPPAANAAATYLSAYNLQLQATANGANGQQNQGNAVANTGAQAALNAHIAQQQAQQNMQNALQAYQGQQQQLAAQQALQNARPAQQQQVTQPTVNILQPQPQVPNPSPMGFAQLLGQVPLNEKPQAVPLEQSVIQGLPNSTQPQEQVTHLSYQINQPWMQAALNEMPQPQVQPQQQVTQGPAPNPHQLEQHVPQSGENAQSAVPQQQPGQLQSPSLSPYPAQSGTQILHPQATGGLGSPGQQSLPQSQQYIQYTSPPPMAQPLAQPPNSPPQQPQYENQPPTLPSSTPPQQQLYQMPFSPQPSSLGQSPMNSPSPQQEQAAQGVVVPQEPAAQVPQGTQDAAQQDVQNMIAAYQQQQQAIQDAIHQQQNAIQQQQAIQDAMQQQQNAIQQQQAQDMQNAILAYHQQQQAQQDAIQQQQAQAQQNMLNAIQAAQQQQQQDMVNAVQAQQQQAMQDAMQAQQQQVMQNAMQFQLQQDNQNLIQPAQQQAVQNAFQGFQSQPPQQDLQSILASYQQQVQQPQSNLLSTFLQPQQTDMSSFFSSGDVGSAGDSTSFLGAISQTFGQLSVNDSSDQTSSYDDNQYS